jgi:hypothetical protein
MKLIMLFYIQLQCYTMTPIITSELETHKVKIKVTTQCSQEKGSLYRILVF